MRYTCGRCGQDWERQPARGQVPKWCPSCRGAAVWDARRAQLLGAFIEYVDKRKVFESDGYRCYLCGKMTQPAEPWPHPLSPTLDHVIPLSRGGLHERANCRCACWSCNRGKSNAGGGEQLLLLAV